MTSAERKMLKSVHGFAVWSYVINVVTLVVVIVLFAKFVMAGGAQ